MGSAVALSIVLALTAAAVAPCEAGGTLGIGGVVQTMNPHLIPPAARFPEHATDQGRNSIDSFRLPAAKPTGLVEAYCLSSSFSSSFPLLIQPNSKTFLQEWQNIFKMP